MADLVNKYPITIFAFTHLNPKMKGVKSHEEGGKVLSQEFSGSRACEKWSNLGLGIERDRSDACPEENETTASLRYCTVVIGETTGLLICSTTQRLLNILNQNGSN